MKQEADTSTIAHWLWRTLVHTGALLFICCVCLLPLSLRAQITPLDGSKLNYRVIGFSFPARQGAAQYTIEIANGNFTDDKQFKGHVRQTVPSGKNKVIIEVPSFGKEYTWRVVYKNNNAVAATSKLYHFATGNIPPNSADSTRLRVKANAGKYKDAYILIDGSNKIYDMNGITVWYLPDTNPLKLESDVKVSPSGTITFLAAQNAYEVSFSGKVLWDAKNKCGNSDVTINDFVFHHEFSKLGNGHYMALLAPIRNEDPANKSTRKKFFPTMSSSTLAEFDKDGNTIWSWESSAYLQRSDLHVLKERYPKKIIDQHENAFYFDEKDSAIYLGMSGISRIVKIQYPSGNVLNEYGRKFAIDRLKQEDTTEPGILKWEQTLANLLFYHQHSLTRSADATLYMFNNNSLMPGLDPNAVQDNYPHILMLQESGDTLVQKWDFDCKKIIGDRILMSGGSAGGNIVLLPDHALFVSMSTPYGDIFIVDADKHLLWNAVFEKYNSGKNEWEDFSKYRASIITMEQMEQLIWNEGN